MCSVFVIGVLSVSKVTSVKVCHNFKLYNMQHIFLLCKNIVEIIMGNFHHYLTFHLMFLSFQCAHVLFINGAMNLLLQSVRE